MGWLSQGNGTNSTGEPRQVWMTSQGTTTITIKWRGYGPPPEKVLVRIASTADFSYRLAGTGSADNGLGAATMVLAHGPFDSGSAVGTRYQYLYPDGNGEAKVSLEKSATAFSYGVDSWASAGARGFTVAIVQSTAFIEPWVSPTYTVGHNDGPIPIVDLDPRYRRMNVGIDYREESQIGYATGNMTAALYGEWNDPNWTWGFSDITRYDGIASLNRQYSNYQVAEIAKTRPLTFYQTLKVTDDAGRWEDATLEIKVYAPQQFPLLTTMFEVTDEQKIVSPYLLRSPTETLQLTNSIPYAKEVTKEITIDGNPTDAPILTENSPLVLALGVESQYGETGTITRTNTIHRTVAIGPADIEFWIVKRNLWRKRSGFYQAYDHNGYAGLRNFTFWHWKSQSKDDAETQDHVYEILTRSVGENNP